MIGTSISVVCKEQHTNVAHKSADVVYRFKIARAEDVELDLCL